MNCPQADYRRQLRGAQRKIAVLDLSRKLFSRMGSLRCSGSRPSGVNCEETTELCVPACGIAVVFLSALKTACAFAVRDGVLYNGATTMLKSDAGRSSEWSSHGGGQVMLGTGCRDAPCRVSSRSQLGAFCV